MRNPPTAGRCGGCLRQAMRQPLQAPAGPGANEIAPVADRCAHQVEHTGGGFRPGDPASARARSIFRPPPGSWDTPRRVRFDTTASVDSLRNPHGDGHRPPLITSSPFSTLASEELGRCGFIPPLPGGPPEGADRDHPGGPWPLELLGLHLIPAVSAPR